MRDGVEGLGEVQGHDCGTDRGFTLVEPPYYGFCNGQQSGSGGPGLPESMLRFRDS